MAERVADFVLDRLRDWGVHRVFAYPGDGINGMLGAFGRAEGDPEFIQPRHEEMAAFMDQVTWEQRAMAGDPKFPASTEGAVHDQRSRDRPGAACGSTCER
jgi:hypothetical protein